MFFFIFEWYLLRYRILSWFFFLCQWFEYAIPLSSGLYGFNKRQLLILLRISYIWWIISFCSFQYCVFLILAFDILIMMCLDVDLFWGFLFGVYRDSLICRFMSLITFERFQNFLQIFFVLCIHFPGL